MPLKIFKITMLYRILTYILVGIGVIYAYIKYMERRGIFYPVKQVEFTPKLIDSTFDDIYIKTQDNITLNGWFIPCNNSKYTIFFLHGNAGNIGHRLEKIKMLREAGLNIFIIDYRGYGRSGGSPFEEGLYYDAKAAYEYLLYTRKISPNKIILYGESLGAAVAIDLAAKSEIKAIILEGAFSCGKDMGREIFPFLPVFFFKDTYNSVKKIKTVKAAKLFLHSKEDEIVPFALSKKLFDSSPGEKFFIELNGSHNDAFLYSKNEYLSAISEFINNNL